ncbi:MAG: hypothetical protein ACN4GF_05110 [Lentimonas sp.]
MFDPSDIVARGKWEKCFQAYEEVLKKQYAACSLVCDFCE